MTIPTMKIHNVETGEIIEREMNAAELAQAQADQLQIQAEAEAAVTKATEKAALLDKLGITDNEAKLLLS
jgi:hypothetical protein